jgi:hypothetical protein
MRIGLVVAAWVVSVVALAQGAELSGVQSGPSDRPGMLTAPSCTCSGGPGGYAYSCPAVQTTCTGGPGNYTYACWVCPG